MIIVKIITVLVILPIMYYLLPISVILFCVGKSNLLGLSKKYGKTEVWFAWFPVKTGRRWVWLKRVNRRVTYNSDMISIAHYVYEELHVDL